MAGSFQKDTVQMKITKALNREPSQLTYLLLQGRNPEDPIFEPLGSPLQGQLGHEDIVDRLPAGTIRLALSEKVQNRAFTCAGKPIYCTQFHPELECNNRIQRLAVYPSYLEKIMDWSTEEFRQHCHDTPETLLFLPCFANHLSQHTTL